MRGMELLEETFLLRIMLIFLKSFFRLWVFRAWSSGWLQWAGDVPIQLNDRRNFVSSGASFASI